MSFQDRNLLIFMKKSGTREKTPVNRIVHIIEVRLSYGHAFCTESLRSIIPSVRWLTPYLSAVQKRRDSNGAFNDEYQRQQDEELQEKMPVRKCKKT